MYKSPSKKTKEKQRKCRYCDRRFSFVCTLCSYGFNRLFAYFLFVRPFHKIHQNIAHDEQRQADNPRHQTWIVELLKTEAPRHTKGEKQNQQIGNHKEMQGREIGLPQPPVDIREQRAFRKKKYQPKHTQR